MFIITYFDGWHEHYLTFSSKDEAFERLEEIRNDSNEDVQIWLAVEILDGQEDN